MRRLDLSSLASVRACAEALNDSEEKLDYLVNNAGMMASPKAIRTEDGFDGQVREEGKFETKKIVDRFNIAGIERTPFTNCVFSFQALTRSLPSSAPTTSATSC